MWEDPTTFFLSSNGKHQPRVFHAEWSLVDYFIFEDENVVEIGYDVENKSS